MTMTRLERVAFGLYTGNIMAAADREGLPFPCDKRIKRAWEGNPKNREQWTRRAEIILSEIPGIDLGAMTGTNPDKVLLSCDARYCRTGAQRALDGVTFLLQILLACISGLALGYYFANL